MRTVWLALLAVVGFARPSHASDWSATRGLEVEPAGALRYLLGNKSWY